MKKIFLGTILMFAAATPLFFASCTTETVEEISIGDLSNFTKGTYNCSANVKIQGEELNYTDMSVEVETQNNNYITFILPPISYSPTNTQRKLPSLTVPNVEMKYYNRDSYNTYAKNKYQGTNNDKQYTITNLTSTIKTNGSIELSYYVTYGSMPQMTVKLTGTKK